MEKVYLVELQTELSEMGLNIVVDIPKPGYPWFGKLDDKPFIMTISPKSREDGIRDFMVISFCGQEEDKVVPLLTKFMSYEPFCKYLYKENPKVTITYEWSRKDPKERFKELKGDESLYKLKKLDKGFQPPTVPGPETYYQQFTPETVKEWEEAVGENPEAKWGEHRIKDILPFVRKVMPRISRSQSVFGLTIISLNGKIKNEEEVVRYGLEPLLKTDILTREDVTGVIEWYLETQPRWEPVIAGYFRKNFVIEDIVYKLITDSYRNRRDLNLRMLFQQKQS
jgi:hypothetical protein